MIEFVNAKINIGLQIVRRREDGYHDLQTIFYPIGRKAGTPSNPIPFCDVLEIIPKAGSSSGSFEGNVGFSFTGRPVDCPVEKNLVYKAARLLYERFGIETGAEIRLEKHIPDGAGIGGGSADAAFTLRMLAEINGIADEPALAEIALMLGADCPFFLKNTPAYASGVGENLETASLDLSGKWLLLVKPDVFISTREAFANVKPKPARFSLRELPCLPIGEWKNCVHNDFEDSIFPRFPLLAEVKEGLYCTGAEYASLTGSGSCLYGIFADETEAEAALSHFEKNPTITAAYLLSM